MKHRVKKGAIAMLITSGLNHDDIEKVIKSNREQNKDNHARLINILKKVTVGEIFYGFTAGGYEPYYEDEDEWKKDLFKWWPEANDYPDDTSDDTIEKDILYDGYDFYSSLPIIEKGENNEVTVCIFLSDEDGDFNLLTSEASEGCMLPLLKLNRDGTETFYDYNMQHIENTILQMKESNTLKNRKHWYDNEE